MVDAGRRIFHVAFDALIFVIGITTLFYLIYAYQGYEGTVHKSLQNKSSVVATAEYSSDLDKITGTDVFEEILAADDSLTIQLNNNTLTTSTLNEIRTNNSKHLSDMILFSSTYVRNNILDSNGVIIGLRYTTQ